MPDHMQASFCASVWRTATSRPVAKSEKVLIDTAAPRANAGSQGLDHHTAASSDREHVLSFLPPVCSKLKSELAHSFRAFAGLGLAIDVLLPLMSLLLVVLLLPPLTFSFKPFHNVDCSSWTNSVLTVVILSVDVSKISSSQLSHSGHSRERGCLRRWRSQLVARNFDPHGPRGCAVGFSMMEIWGLACAIAR